MLPQILFVVFVIWLLVSRWQRRGMFKLWNQLKNDIKMMPIVGHAYLFLGTDEDRMQVFQKFGIEAYKTGGLYALWQGSRLYVNISDPEIAELVLKTCLEKDDVLKVSRMLTGNGSVFAPVPIWRPRRKFLAPTFSPKNLVQFAQIFSHQSNVMVDQLKGAAGKGPFSIWKYITTYSMDSVCESTLGVQANSQRQPDQPFLKAFEEICKLDAARICQPWLHNDALYKMTPYYRQHVVHRAELCGFIDRPDQPFLKAFEEICKLDAARICQPWLHNDALYKMTPYYRQHVVHRAELCGFIDRPDQPFLKAFEEICKLDAARICQPWLHNDALYKMTPYYRQHVVHRAELCGFIDRIIKKKRLSMKEDRHRQPESDQHSDNQMKTFLELLIESTGGEQGFTDLELQEETLVLVLAGTDTSAVGTAFTALMLSRHPEVQEKVYQELQEVFDNSDRPITVADLPRLRYLDAVVRETLRLYPPAPVIVRKAMRDLPLRLILAKNCGLVVNIWAINRNPKYWGEDSMVYRPERWLDMTLTHPAAFMSFSYGPRGCIGYRYAMMSMKTAVATLVRHYRLLPATPVRDKQASLRTKFDVMMKHVDNFEVQLEERNDSQFPKLHQENPNASAK